MPLTRTTLFSAVLFMALAGCSSAPGRITAPDVDAAEAAAAAIEKYDRDADDRLNESELAACPSLQCALAGYDSDADKALTAAEIQAGIARWTEQKTGAITLPFQVTLDGRPLAGANIKIVPEDFMQDAVKPASATANNAGSGFLGMSKEDRPANAPNLPLVQPGLYRVEITHPTVSLPAKYNTETTLGLEASIAGQNASGVTWSLTSK